MSKAVLNICVKSLWNLAFISPDKQLGVGLLGHRLPWWLRWLKKKKKLPAMQETWVRSLGREGPLEKRMTTYSNILARRIPGTVEPGGLLSMGLQRIRQD